MLFGARRNTVKHNRSTDVFEAGNIRFGLEKCRLPTGDGGSAIHVLGDMGGGTRKTCTEETELLAFEMGALGATLTGYKGLPAEVTQLLAAQ